MMGLSAPAASGGSCLTLENSAVLLGDLFAASEELWRRQETLERATNAMNAALAWLHDEIQQVSGAVGPSSTDIDAVWGGDASSGSGSGSISGDQPCPASDARVLLIGKLLDAFDHWHQQQQQSDGKALPMRFWLLWVEFGSSLSVLTALDASAFPSALQRRGSQAATTLTRAASTVKNALLPVGFPTASSHCDKRLQVDFCANLWNAGVYRPLQGRSERKAEGPQHHVAVQLLTTFTAWVARAMSGYEIVFLSAVEQTLGALVRESAHTLGVSRQILTQFVSTHIARSEESSAAGIAVSAVVATALSGLDRDDFAQVDSLLNPLRDDVVQKLILSPLPHVQQPLAIVAAGLGMAAWGVEPAVMAPPSWSRVITEVFAVTRAAVLPLLSSRIVTDERRLEEATQRVLSELRALLADQGKRRGNMVELVYRVLESGVAETIAFFHSSSAQHAALVSALQSAMPSELFRPALTSYVALESKKSATVSPTAEFSPDKALNLLKHLYDAVAPILLDLSTYQVESLDQLYRCLVRSFALLTRLEFAREAWTSPSRNQTMSTITQHIEQAIDQAPDAVFAAIFRSLNASLANNHDLWPDSSEEKAIPDEMDVVRGCQVLAVGLLIQRKLRALLIQSSSPQLRDDAIAVVFLGVNSAYEPLDTFAHRFLGVCLSHLAQFVSMHSIAPYYVQLSLPAFPSNMTQQTIAAVCGSVFGALFYSQASAEVGESSSPSGFSSAEVARRMTLWVMKQFLNRSKELLLADVDNSSDTGASSVNSDGIYLVGLMAEIIKMSPLDVIDKAAMEMEALVRDCDQFDSRHRRQVCTQVKRTIFTSISQNCEAEKRAWLAAWFIELETHYPSGPTANEASTSDAINDNPAAATSRL